MTVLGIHGNYLNLNAEVFESSASIVKDGQVLFAISEERLSRRKCDGRFPFDAIEEAMKVTGLEAGDIDQVAFASRHPKDDCWNYFKSAVTTYFDTSVLLKHKLKTFLWGWLYNSLKKSNRLEFKLSEDKSLPINFVDHHLCHAAGAYYASPFEHALVFTLDGGGNGLDGSVYYANSTKLQRVMEIPHFQSPGTMYSAITHDLGFKRHRHEGKITGLAAYGTPRQTEMGLDELIRYDASKHRFISKQIANHHHNLRSESSYFGPLLKKFSKEDVACTVQNIFESVVTDFIKDGHAVAKAKGLNSNQICLAGGCFANVALNQKIRELEICDNVFVFPAMSDGGLSTGAALVNYFDNNHDEDRASASLDNVYLADDFTEAEMEKALKGSRVAYSKHNDIETDIAKLLQQGKVVARFNGAMEFGPRALGNRSILAAPFDSSINDWLNKKLRRTEFMPFAPSILQEHAHDCLENYGDDHVTSDFMTITYKVKEPLRSKVPAVVHIDHTARPQIVKASTNPSYHRIISEFEKLTGVPAILNTSFNIHEEPIVYTPADAIRGFLDAKLDYLAMGPYLVAYPEADNDKG